MLPTLTKSVSSLLSDAGNRNIAVAPVNLFIALGMLAEITDGDSRQQILDYAGCNDIESLRTMAKEVWRSHYCKDGATTSVLASSIWLDNDVAVDREAMESLAENYYTSSYQGDMGSDEYTDAFRDWLNEQTGGLLNNQVDSIELDADMLLTLATTVYFQAKWSSEFDASDNTDGIFHGAISDVEVEFMNERDNSYYFWGDNFGAVQKSLANDGGNMWFILPDEGITIDELLADPQLSEFISTGSAWENKKHLMVNLTLPKFDISSQFDVGDKLKDMGIVDIFDTQKANFSAIESKHDALFISAVDHSVRVSVDEEGVSAAAYTAMLLYGARLILFSTAHLFLYLRVIMGYLCLSV